MAWTDPIVEEVRQVRQAHAAKFDYDLDRICADIKARELASGRTYVRLPPRRPASITLVPIQANQELAPSN